MNGTRATGCVRAKRGGPVRTAVACLVLTGASCSPAQPSPGGSGAPERTGAPRVDEPLAIEAKRAYPCASLTDAQAVAAGAPPGTEHRAPHDGTGAACLREPEASAEGAKITVSWATGTPDLDVLYGLRDEQAYSEEPALRGYPAVFSAAVDAFGEDGSPGPCDAARKAAESVVDNLRQNPAA
ncbi:hypothetical protein CLM85_03045 [Streptomyces albidoflavus]|uniref:DUF3558 domain-containing protein n=1 Tax=Streptomyces albidoflavus TaxID=1886 RepID=UPI000BAE1EDA|nr:DUF3558 domain-containing protein [Streptomyces albidoflavus]PAX84582.1 hypothetical protein CLM81_16045 [Streptomyces albidoflavus]PAX88467.1 hypothetical protein CLM82_24160 [Streptomyces albidoflavus]PBO18825.1 hypothetical protein CLM83_10075 [Streptomyces albidoflavus]PBO25635.1 hypothetical protein CLM85_03045 [Streptomyces albidoflavus]PBO30430.1 hypothetical protein CLM84_08560 [Streptomyces albidoflavus]